MPTTLRITPPTDYHLPRDACSYGYFLLAPNRWHPRTQTLTRTLATDAGPTRLAITQPGVGDKLTVRCDRTLDRASQQRVRAGVTRMLRLDEPAETIAQFHKVDKRWKKSGRGRLFRSPTLFEDIVKTVTSCNVQWPSTVHMNRRLCEVLGDKHDAGGTFPTSAKIARTRPSTLRARCRFGYRDARTVELAKLRRRGAIDEAWLEDPATPDEDVRAFLITLPGIGPYAAANIMQLLGRYAHLPLDTESVRHGKVVLGMTGTDAQIMKKVDAHFAPFDAHRFRSYWFELWSFYEAKRGPSHLWDQDEVGSTFTASQL